MCSFFFSVRLFVVFHSNRTRLGPSWPSCTQKSILPLIEQTPLLVFFRQFHPFSVQVPTNLNRAHVCFSLLPSVGQHDTSGLSPSHATRRVPLNTHGPPFSPILSVCVCVAAVPFWIPLGGGVGIVLGLAMWGYRCVISHFCCVCMYEQWFILLAEEENWQPFL